MSLIMPLEALPTFRILVVDDEAGDIELAKLALADGPFPCQVRTAGNGREALELLRRCSPDSDDPLPDLMLLDLNMPQMSGKEVLKEMREDAALVGIPVVVLTTSDVERDVAAAYQLGAAGFITKPMEMEELFRAIRAVEEYWFGTVRRPRRAIGC